MPSLYELGRLLARLVGAINLIVGIAAWIACLIVGFISAAVGGANNAVTATVVAYLAEYGTAAVVAGITVLMLNKAIARFASKSN